MYSFANKIQVSITKLTSLEYQFLKEKPNMKCLRAICSIPTLFFRTYFFFFPSESGVYKYVYLNHPYKAPTLEATDHFEVVRLLSLNFEDRESSFVRVKMAKLVPIFLFRWHSKL